MYIHIHIYISVGFPRLGGTILRVPIMGFKYVGGLYWGPLI